MRILAMFAFVAAMFMSPQLRAAKLPAAGMAVSVTQFITRGKAAAKARDVHRGRVLSVRLVSYKGKKSYRIKILGRDGRVRVLYVNARTGKIM